MLFPTVTFALFFIAVHTAHVVLVSRDRSWKLAMLAASYVFYGWWDWRFCALLAASTALNWLAARGLAATGSPRLRPFGLALTIAVNLGVLCLFKYYGFFLDALSATGRDLVGAVPALELVLPVGISFFTFQALSYVIDVYRGDIGARGPLDVALYLAFFPQLVAGPIVRAATLLPQFAPGGRQVDIDVVGAAWWIGRGLFKKVVVAGYLADTVVDAVFAAPSAASRLELMMAMYGYAVQIYADFSGYTDIAIGIAALLGIRFPPNFDRPYRALSVQDFWRRWHLSLSHWLRDYLYIPLGGSRGSSSATYRNLMITMVLGGLWHGAGWTFVLWGMVHGLALGAERAAGATLATAAGGRGGQVLRWLVTFHVVCLAWVLFRSENLDLAGQFLLGLVRAPVAGPVNLTAVAVVGTALVVQWAPDQPGDRIREAVTGLTPTVQGALAGAVLSLVVVLGPAGVDPFIYFQF